MRGALRLRYVMILLFVGGLFATYTRLPAWCRRRSCRRKTKATSCASCRRRPARRSSTRPRLRRRPKQIIYADKDVAAAFAVMGFSFSGAAPNNGMIFVRLKDYEERQATPISR